MTANDDRARKLIEEYPRHPDNETAYLRGGFVGVDVSAVVAILLAMLRSRDRERTWHAIEFINQAVIRHASPEFTEALPRLGVYRTLRDLLYVPDHNIRHNAVYALGKTTHRPNARYLVGALPTYIERYPLELDGLFFELFWLSRTHRRRRWEYYEQVAASPSYIVRWALLEILDRVRPDDVSSADAGQLEQLYRRLTRDSRYLVAAEADYVLALLRLRWEGQTLPSQEYRRLKRLREGAKPRLTFTRFSDEVGRHLSAMGRSDYDLELLDQFARYLTDHPIETPFDYAAHGRAFEAWRQRERR